MANPDDVFLDFPDRTLTFTHSQTLAGWRRLLNGGRPSRRVQITVVLRTLPLAELLIIEKTMNLFKQRLQESGHDLDLAAVCLLIAGPKVRALPTEALQKIWDAYRELNYPKATEAKATTSPMTETPPPTTPSPSEQSSADSSDSPSPSPKSESSA